MLDLWRCEKHGLTIRVIGLSSFNRSTRTFKAGACGKRPPLRPGSLHQFHFLLPDGRRQAVPVRDKLL